jgi:hypothetical protein
MKVYKDQPNFVPIHIKIETENELVTLKTALGHAIENTKAIMVPGLFGIPMTDICGARHVEYRTMLNQLDM